MHTRTQRAHVMLLPKTAKVRLPTTGHKPARGQQPLLASISSMMPAAAAALHPRITRSCCSQGQDVEFWWRGGVGRGGVGVYLASFRRTSSSLCPEQAVRLTASHFQNLEGAVSAGAAWCAQRPTHSLSGSSLDGSSSLSCSSSLDSCSAATDPRPSGSDAIPWSLSWSRAVSRQSARWASPVWRQPFGEGRDDRGGRRLDFLLDFLPLASWGLRWA